MNDDIGYLDPELLKEIEGDLGKGVTQERYSSWRPRVTIDAYSIAHALNGVASGNGYKCSCPVPGHGKGEGDRDRSLFIRNGDTPGRVLVTCFANCDRSDM